MSERLENHPPEEELPDGQILKGVYEKCTKQYPEAKYQSPLFFENVFLDEAELQEIDTMIQQARTWWEFFKTQEAVEWNQFSAILQERRDKVGSLGEMKHVIPQEGVGRSKKALSPEGVPLIIVSPSIHALYVWELKIKSVIEKIRLYRNAPELLSGGSAKLFGTEIREIYLLFLKEAAGSSKK